MPMLKRCFSGTILVASIFLAGGLARAAQFTATMITKAGGMEIPARIFVKDNKVRNEVQFGGQNSIHILRPDKQVVWIILPQQKAYMEMPVTQEAAQKLMPVTAEQMAKMTKVGSDTINGYACDKYETSMPHQGKPVKITTWVANDLGMPIKVVAADGSFAVDYKDIKPAQLEDSLFEVPKDYKKLNMPMAMPPAK
jgi:hypothetical protein